MVLFRGKFLSDLRLVSHSKAKEAFIYRILHFFIYHILLYYNLFIKDTTQKQLVDPNHSIFRDGTATGFRSRENLGETRLCSPRDCNRCPVATSTMSRHFNTNPTQCLILNTLLKLLAHLIVLLWRVPPCTSEVAGFGSSRSSGYSNSSPFSQKPCRSVPSASVRMPKPSCNDQVTREIDGQSVAF